MLWPWERDAGVEGRSHAWAVTGEPHRPPTTPRVCPHREPHSPCSLFPATPPSQEIPKRIIFAPAPILVFRRFQPRLTKVIYGIPFVNNASANTMTYSSVPPFVDPSGCNLRAIRRHLARKLTLFYVIARTQALSPVSGQGVYPPLCVRSSVRLSDPEG
jgi:hypothetical protein